MLLGYLIKQVCSKAYLANFCSLNSFIHLVSCGNIIVFGRSTFFILSGDLMSQTRPCLCRQCGHDTSADGGFRLPHSQDERERRRLLKSLGCDRHFDNSTFQDFMSNEKTRSSQRISKHHFTVAQLRKVQGGNTGLKNDAIADIPLNEMMKPLFPVGTASTKRKSEPHPEAPRSTRNRGARESMDSPHPPMSPFEASLCDCCHQPNISPHPMPSFPPTPTLSEPLLHDTSTNLPHMTRDEYEKVISTLKSELATARELIKVMEHNAGRRYALNVPDPQCIESRPKLSFSHCCPLQHARYSIYYDLL